MDMQYDIILIDDDDDELFVAQKCLAKAKAKAFTITHYESRERALSVLSKNKVQAKLILVDLHIPGDMSADDFIYKLKAIKGIAGTPIILMSLHDEDNLPKEYSTALAIADGYREKTHSFKDDAERWIQLIDDYLIES